MEMADEMTIAFASARAKQFAKDPERLKQYWEKITRDREPPAGMTFEEFLEILLDLEGRFEIHLNPQASMALGLMQAQRMLPELLNMRWCLCRAPQGVFFITSDSPVNVFVLRGHMALFGAGYKLEAVEIAFPISPEVCLYLRRKGGQLRRSVSQAFVREVNRRTAAMAERFVFSHVRSRVVQALVAEFAFTREMAKVDREDVRRRIEAKQQKRDPVT